MPEYATFHNTIFDIRCSKCKRTQENQFFVQRGRVFKTCNACRDRSRVGRLDPDFVASVGGPGSTVMGATRHIPDSDTESEPSINPHAALVALGFSYADTNNVLLLSSAAAASSSSSADYFVEEPYPEPEPEGP